jgi:hypothetical protein
MKDLRVGDRVKIIEDGRKYYSGWIVAMDQYIGSTGVIQEINPHNSRKRIVTDEQNPNCFGYWYPEECLELITEKIFSVSEEKEEDSEKFISMYPHKCPKCKAPAYINFFDKVDCSRGSCDGIINT